jgi:tetratricopeptide (TPR) repeat protein/O-antigen ligase
MDKSVPLNGRVIEAGWLAVAAGLPLFTAPWGQNPFELPKAVLLWAVAAVMGAVWLTRCKTEAERFDTRRTTGALAIAFAIVLILSTLFSVNPLQSAQGSYDRMQGALTVLCNLALFLMVADRLRTPAQVERLLAAIAWGSAPVVIYGLLQALKLDPLRWQVESSPVISTLGRSNFVGAYLALALPITLACAWQARDQTRRIIYIGLTAAQLACLAATTSRAAWLGALAAGGVLLLAIAWNRGHHRLATLAACIGLAGFLGGLIALTFATGLTGSVGARAAIWRATWSLVAARPILGYGPETFRQVFTAVFPPELVYLQGRAVIVDRAHNLILDTLTSTGGVGLLAYAALIGTTLVTGVRALIESQDRRTRVVLTVGLAAIAGHLVETQLSFPVTTTATLFWITLGALAGRWTQSPSSAIDVQDKHRAPWPRQLLAVSLLAAVLPASIAILAADANAGQARHTRTVAELQRSIAAMERAVTLWPTQPAYHEHLSWLHLQLAQRDYNSHAEFRSAEAALDAARRLSPDHYRIWAGLGELYTEWGKAGDPNRFAQAELAFKRATTLFPGSAMLHTGWGLSYMTQNRIAEATAQFHQAAHLDHTDAWAFWRLGDALLAQDDLAGAEQAYGNALRWAPGLVEAHRGLGHIYYRRGQFESALLAYQTALSLTPDDPNLHLDVARCRWDMGQRELACQAVAHGLLMSPNHPGLLAFFAGCK